MNSKRGSSAVFLMVILATLITITLALIYGARKECVRSRADGIINLAGDSVMSEFNYDVQKEYGLFLIKGSDKELTKKLRRYINYSIEDMKDVRLEKLKVSGSRFSTANIDLIKNQILEYMKLVSAEDSFNKRLSDADKENINNMMENRVLRHGPTAVSLPSVTIPEKKLTSLAESIAAKADQVDKVFKAGTETYMINKYILHHFNNKDTAVNTEHFFKNEAEYILGGKLSDRKNEKRVEIALKAMRFPLNLAHIYKDPEKSAATLALAEILAPEAATATQAILASTWAYAESDNDVELLWQGHKVPMIKDKGSWAIDLDSAVEGITGNTVIPAREKGYDYQQYLQILLFFQDENIKIGRILDLIQINMRKSYDGDFLINEHVGGINIEAKVNDRVYEYDKKY